VYLQYTIARLNSLVSKYEAAFGALPSADAVPYDRLSTDSAGAIVAHLERWPAELRKAADAHEPAVVARFALDAAELFNGFYSSGNKVISDDAELSAARVMLAIGVRNAIAMCLNLLGVPMPARM
jgi:arginyl-tRNA synthetase